MLLMLQQGLCGVRAPVTEQIFLLTAENSNFFLLQNKFWAGEIPAWLGWSLWNSWHDHDMIITLHCYTTWCGGGTWQYNTIVPHWYYSVMLLSCMTSLLQGDKPTDRDVTTDVQGSDIQYIRQQTLTLFYGALSCQNRVFLFHQPKPSVLAPKPSQNLTEKKSKCLNESHTTSFVPHQPPHQTNGFLLV